MNRSEQQKPRPGCKPMPELKEGEEPSEDELSGWCPPAIADSTRGLQARFGPALGFDPPRSVSNSANAPGTLPVVPSSKRKPNEDNPRDVRSARIKLTSGNYAILQGADDSTLCLCRATTFPSSKMFDGEVCDSAWKRKHSPNKACVGDDEAGTLPFGEDGGEIRLRAGDRATVTVE